MKKEIIATVALVLIAGGLGVGYYISQAFPVSNTGVNSTTYAASNPDLGLRLVISLDASTIHAGGSVNYTASVYNTRPSQNNVSSASNWATPRLIMTACGPTDSPIAFAILQGHYTSGNLSGAPSLDYGVMSSTVFGGATVVSFQPSSDVASVYASMGYCNSNPCFTKPVSTWRVLSQYPSGVGTVVQWGRFTPGEYTVLAEDEWGDVALATFAVA